MSVNSQFNAAGGDSRQPQHVTASGNMGEGASSSRRSFLHRSGLTVAAGAAATAILSPSMVRAAAAKKEKVRSPSAQRTEFESIMAHENAHVAFLVAALGAAARPKPNFKGLEQAKVLDFVEVSQALENTGVGAYLGALPVISSMDITASAGTIALIEARHAGYLNTLIDDPITGNALDNETDNNFETPLTIDQVVTNAMGFIQDLNGGPDLTFSTTPSADNDIAILNFALALEYLEAEYYNINVPKFYKPKRTK